MYQSVIFFIGLRYIYGSAADKFCRFISWLSTIGIMFGVMALVMVFSVMNGFERELQENILEMIPQVIISSKIGSISPKKIPESEINLKDVIRISPLTTSDVVIQSSRNVALGIMMGIDPFKKDPLASYLIAVKQTDLAPNQYNVILGTHLARKLEVKVGDRVRIIVPSVSQFTPIGRLPVQRIFNVIGTFSINSEVDSYQVFVNIKDASHLMNYIGDNITGWRLWLKEPLNVDKLSKTLFRWKNMKWEDWRTRKGELFQAVSMEKNIMGLLLSLIILIASFSIIASVSLMIMEKKGEIAILQAQGLMSHQITEIFILQGIGIGVIGSLLGAALGMLLVNPVARIIPVISKFPHSVILPVEINPLQVSSIVLITIFISFFSTLYPSWYASSIQPSQALRYE